MRPPKWPATMMQGPHPWDPCTSPLCKGLGPGVCSLLYRPDFSGSVRTPQGTGPEAGAH